MAKIRFSLVGFLFLYKLLAIYINLFIESTGKKKLIVIECKNSHQPAFLYYKNDETFYIRSGPVSVSLSISKALKYIQGHQF